jgi:hypothetical protein
MVLRSTGMLERPKGTCEKCGKFVGFVHLDYCAECSRDLCEDCMKKGCCGHVPALSGTREGEEEPRASDF